MTKIINLYGGPGSGKSTTATGVFSQLKLKGINCEYVSEYAKDVVWEQANSLLDNQLHIFAEQFRRQFRLIGKVDYVITDSPLILSCVYFDHWFRKRNTSMFNDAYCDLTKQYFFESFKQFDNVNWMIARKKAYNPKGRLQTLDEAKQLDADIHNFLLKNWVDYKLTDSLHAIEDITNDILGLPPRSDYSQMHEDFNGFPEPKKKKSWLFGR
jgi:hypothetical protein